jgi:hypothetical protein
MTDLDADVSPPHSLYSHRSPTTHLRPHHLIIPSPHCLHTTYNRNGYEKLCCVRCIQTRDMNYQGSTCICRVPKAQLKAGTVVECVHCGEWSVSVARTRGERLMHRRPNDMAMQAVEVVRRIRNPVIPRLNTRLQHHDTSWIAKFAISPI